MAASLKFTKNTKTLNFVNLWDVKVNPARPGRNVGAGAGVGSVGFR